MALVRPESSRWLERLERIEIPETCEFKPLDLRAPLCATHVAFATHKATHAKLLWHNLVLTAVYVEGEDPRIGGVVKEITLFWGEEW